MPLRRRVGRQAGQAGAGRLRLLLLGAAQRARVGDQGRNRPQNFAVALLRQFGIIYKSCSMSVRLDSQACSLFGGGILRGAGVLHAMIKMPRRAARIRRMLSSRNRAGLMDGRLAAWIVAARLAEKSSLSSTNSPTISMD